MADRFWVGGSGNWNTTSTTNWSATSGGPSGASVPTAADSVFFDQASTYTVTTSTSLLNCLDLTVSAGTVTFAGASTINVAGNWSTIAGALWTGTGTIAFTATTSRTINSNNIAIAAAVTFNGIGGAWSLQSNFRTSGTTTLTNGSLTLNTHIFTTAIFSSTISNNRAINFGTGKIVLNNTTATSVTIWDCSFSGFTVSGTPLVESIGGSSSSANKSIRTGNPAFITDANAISFSLLDTDNVRYTLGDTTFAGTFKDLTFNGTQTISSNSSGVRIYGSLLHASTNGTTTIGANGSWSFIGPSGTQTISVPAGATYPMNVTFNGSASTTYQLLSNFNLSGGVSYTATLTTGALSLQSFTLTTGGFSSTNSNTRSINFGTGKIVLIGSSVVWDTATVTGLSVTGTSLVELTSPSNCTVSAGALNEQNAINFSFLNSGTSVITLTAGNTFRNLIFNGNQSVNNVAITIFGNFTHTTSNGTTTFVSGLNAWTFGATSGSYNINPQSSVTYNFPWIIGSAATTATWTLQNNLSVGDTRSVTLAGGTVDFNNRGISSPTNSFTLAITGPVTLNNTGGSTLTIATSVNQTGGTLTLGTNLTLNTAASIYTLTAGTLNLGTFTLTTLMFNSTNSNTRTINFGTGKIVLNGPLTNTIWNTGTVTGLTISGTPLVECTGGGTGVTKTINTGALSEANSINFSLLETSGTATYVFTAGNTVRNLVVGGPMTINNIAITIFGSFTHSTTGGTPTFAAGVNTWTFAATSGNYAITNASVIYDWPWTFGSAAGTATWTLANNLVLGSAATRLLTLTNGTLDVNNKTVTGNFTITVITGSFTLNNTGGTTFNTTVPITHTSGSLTLGSNITTTNAAGYLLTAGNLNINSYTLQTPAFASSATNTRAINFGTGKISLVNATTATIWNTATVTNFSYTGTPLIECRGGGTAVTKTITTGTMSESQALDFNFIDTGGTPTYAFTAGTTVFGNLVVNGAQTITTIVVTIFKQFTHTTTNGTTTFTAGANAWSFLASSGNYTITSVAGFTYDFPINIGTTGTTASYTLAANLVLGATRQLTLNNGTIDFNNRSIGGNITFSNANNITLLNTGGTTASWTASITHTAGSLTLPFNLTTTGANGYTLTAGALNLNGFGLTTTVFSSSNSNTRSIAFGSGNIVLNAASGTVLSMAILGGFSRTGTGGFVADASVVRTYTVGSTSGGATTNVPSLTFTGSGTAIPVLTTGSRFDNLNFGTTAFTLAATSLFLNTLTLSSGGTFTGLTATMFGTGTITPNGKTIAALTINHNDIPSGTTTLAGLLGCTTYTQTQGTLDFATFNLTCSSTAVYTAGTLINIGTIACTTWTCDSTFTLTQGTITPSVSFVVAAGGFNYNGGTLSAVPAFTQNTGTVSFGQSYALTATGTYTFTAGVLSLNDNINLTTGAFSSSNANIRSILFGTGNIVLTHSTAATTVLALDNATNFNCTGTGGFVSDAAVTRTFTFGTSGGTFFNAPNLAITSGAAIPTITTNSWLKALNFTGSTCAPAAATVNVDTLTLATGGTYTNLVPQFTRTQTWTAQFGKQLGGVGVNRLFTTLTLDGTQTFTATSTCSLVTGTLDLGGSNLTIGLFSSSGTEPRAVVFGNNNIVLNHSTAAQTVLSVANATNFSYTSTGGGFVSDAAVTRTFVFGTTGGSTSNAPDLLINSGAAIPTITTGSWFNRLDFTGSACTPAATVLNIGSLILSTGGTFTGLSATMRSNGIIAPNGKTIAALVVNHSETGTTTLAGALTCTTQSYINGNVDFAGFNLTGTAVTYNNGVFSNINVLACTTFTIAGNFELVTGTLTPSTSIVLSSGSFTYTGGTLSPVGTFTQTAGTVILNRAYSLTATGTYTLTAGSLNLNGYNLTTGIFFSNGTGTRSIAFGTGDIVLTHTTAATTVLAMANATNFTWSGTGGFVRGVDVRLTYDFGRTAGGSAINAPNLSLNGGTSNTNIITNSWFKKLDFTGNSGTAELAVVRVDTLILATGGTYTPFTPIFTRSQAWTSQFGKQLGGIGVDTPGGTLTLDGTQTYTATSICYLFSGTLNLGGVDLTVGAFNSENTNIRSINFGSNDIVLTDGSGSVLTVSNGTNFTYTGTGGFRSDASVARTFRFGSSAGGTPTNSPNLRFTGSGTAIQAFIDGSWFNKLDFGTTAFNPGLITLNLNSLTLSSTGTYNNLTINAVGPGTIISNGNTSLSTGTVLTINHNGITLLGDNLSTSASSNTSAVVLTSGTLDLGGYELSVARFISSGTVVRSILFRTGNIIIRGSGTVLSMADVTNFTYTGTGRFVAANDFARTFTFGTTGGSPSNAPNLAVNTGITIPTFTNGSWFKELNFTGSANTPAMSAITIGIYVDTLTLATGGTYTGLIPVFTRTQTWTSQFSKQLGGIGVGVAGVTLTLDGTQTYTATSSCILTAGTLNLGDSNQTFGTFNSSNTNTRAVAFGANNIILATTTAAAVNLAMANATGFTWTGTGGFTAAADITRTFTFGTTGGTAANAPRLALTGSGTAIPTLTGGSWFDTLDFGTTAFTLAATTLNLDSLTLSTGGTFTNLTVNMVGTGTITPNGKTVATITINHTGTTTLAGALSVGATATTTLTSGTLNLNNFTLTTGIFSSSNTNARSIQFGTANIILVHTTAATTVLSMATATNFTRTGTGGFSAAADITRTFAFGNTIGGRSDNAPNLLLTSGAAIPTLASGSWFNTLNFTGTTSTPATTTVNVNSIILATGGTYTGLTVNMVGTGNITSNGKTIAALNVNSNNPLSLVSYKIYTFTSSGSITFPVSNAPPSVEYLVVAGGGGGAPGQGAGGGGGGGGAGGMILSIAQVVPNTEYPIVVGTGGGQANNGSPSSFFGNQAIGGGAGATRNNGGSGGSGGGAGGGTASQFSGGAGTAGQGNAGGANNTTADNSGGGGGAGGAGGNATGPNPGTSGLGGVGLLSSISGVPTYYAGGGGGGGGGGPAAGGLGGGGQGGGVAGQAGGAGTANTGGGGGGGGQDASVGGQGGSGIVVIRYQAIYADPISTTGSPNVSTAMDAPPIPSSVDVTTLNDALTITGTSTLTLGQLNLNNFTLTTGGLNSSNTNVRTIAFGSGSIALTGTAALAMADATNFTYTGTGNLTSAMSAIRTFTFGSTAGGSVSNAMNLSLTSGASIPTLTVGSWFKVLNFTGTTSTPAVTTVYVDTLTLATGGTYTGLTPIFTRTQTWTSQFSKVLDGIGFNLAGGTLTLNNTQTYSATGSCNLIAGTLDLGGANLTVGRFISNNSNTRAVAFGANNIVLANTIVDALNLDILDATGFTWTGTGGFVAAANIARRYAVGTSLAPSGAEVYTTPGTYTWIAPAGVTSVCVVAVGAGGSGRTYNVSTGHAEPGGGGGLGWKNNIAVVPGQSYTVVVGNSVIGGNGQSSYFIDANVVAGFGGGAGTGSAGGSLGGSYVGDGGGAGGNGSNSLSGGAGGAGGYSGPGGNGPVRNISNRLAGNPGQGGGGGGGGAGAGASSIYSGGGGGGIGLYGQGANGAGGAAQPGTGSGNGGGGGSGGTNGVVGGSIGNQSDGGLFGGGAGGATESGGRATPGTGAVRIMWGPDRAFPSALTAAIYDVVTSGEGAASAANAPNLTFTGSGTAVQTFVSGSWFNNLNFGTTAFAVPASTIKVSTLTLSSAGTYTGLVPVFTRTQTWTPQHSKQLGGIGVNGAGVTLTLGATQTYNPLSSKLIVNAGTVNLAGNSVDFYDVESTKSGSRTITGAGTLNVYNNWTVYVGAGFDAAGTTINMASNNFFKTFAGGGGTYGTLVQKSAAPMTVTGSNTFENIQVSDTMSPITPPAAIDFLMVAGGGGHQIGGDANAGHGGAGAGGLLYRTAYTIPTSVLTGSKTITVTVGAGGAAANGTNSTIATADNTIAFTTIGGGRGGVFNGNGIAGGSGGGGGGRDYPPGDGGAAQQPTSASGGVGFAGGRCRTGNDGSGTAAGGGGGGAGAVGANGVSRQGGVGGAGLAIPIINTTNATTHAIGQVISADVWFAGGGGGMANGTGGAGGAGGGAPGASSVFQGSGISTNTQSNATGVRNGKSNTGGGAGGAATGYSGYGGTGGSGVVVIRHARIAGYEAATTGGCTIEYEGTDILYIFKSSGTITF